MDNTIGLVGYLGYAVDSPIVGGQLSKTRGIEKELKAKYQSVMTIDTSNWKKEKIWLILRCFKMAFSCRIIIIMPNKNGIKIILPLFSILKKIVGFRIAYPVVGGWLPTLLKNNKYLKAFINEVDYLLPETEKLRQDLQDYYAGLIDVMPIFSLRNPVLIKGLGKEYAEPYVFCTFSRVTPEKGVDDAIEAISLVNKRAGKVVCRLEVWGPVEGGLESHYNAIFRKYANCVTYRGIIKEEQGLEILSAYYMNLFPSFYPGEGFPTTICESFMAGLPVIASDWRFNGEVIQNGKNGYLVPVHDINSLVDIIENVIEYPEKIVEMHFECLKESQKFSPDQAMKKINDWILETIEE